MIKRIPPALRRLFHRQALPVEIRIALTVPLYTRVASLMLGHIAGLAIACFAVLRIDAPWPAVNLAALVFALAARLTVLAIAKRRRSGGDLALLKLTPWYCAIGIYWALSSGIFTALCLSYGNTSLSMFALTLAMGTSGGLASRNAGTPRFANAQLLAWLMPQAVAGPLLGGDFWTLSIMTVLYLVALRSIVRQQYSDLTSLLLTERANHSLATRFDAAISNMSQGLLLFDANQTLLVINRRFREMFAGVAELLQPGARLHDAAEQFESIGLDGQWLWGGHEASSEFRDLRDGRCMSINHETLADGGRVITFADITKHRQAERALAERESELQAIFANAAAGLSEHEVSTGRFTRINRVFCKIFGRSESELMTGLTAADLSQAEDLELLEGRFRDIIENGAVAEYEKRFVRPDGTELWCRVSAAGISPGGDGRPKRIVTIIHDITERKAVEAALRESEEIRRLSMEVGRIGTSQRDYVANVIRCSPEALAMHGLPVDEHSITPDVWTATIPPEDRARHVAYLQAVQLRHERYHQFEYRCRLATTGAIRHIEARVRIEYDAQGTPLRSIGVVIDVTERRQAEARIAHLAHHDPLTDLPNRALFHIRLTEAFERTREGETFALFYLDLDHFKEVNDSMGHPVGDALLRAVTERLCAEVRKGDTVARLGGDEFAIIQVPCHRSDDALALGQRLIERLCEPFDLVGQTVTIGTSVGIAFAPTDGGDAEQLLKNADLALYHSKEAGRGQLLFFTPEMNAKFSARRNLDRDLRTALEVGGFELFYQPLVNIETSEILSFEALIRWRHPERGMVRPDDFIPAAEANGLIVQIGEWVLDAACAQAMRWPAELRIAVNISVIAVTTPGLVDAVAGALQRSGLDPARLELEITETVMLQETEATLATLHQLKQLGVRIALDDFGAGFSSLHYMQKFPFDKVKIDRSFITDLVEGQRSSTIVRAIIDLCAALGMDTVAEGVETAEQLSALAAQGCKEAQGYYFSRPRPASEVAELLVPAKAA